MYHCMQKMILNGDDLYNIYFPLDGEKFDLCFNYLNILLLQN